jgi:hypothetical protein
LKSLAGVAEAAALALLLTGVVALGLKLAGERTRASDAMRDLRTLRDSAQLWRLEAHANEELLTRLDLPGALSGTDVKTGERFTVALVERQAFYLVSPTCRACEENLPTVIALSRAFSGRMTVLTSASVADARLAYERYLDSLRVVSVDGQSLYQVFASLVTPITLAADGRHRLKYWYGEVTPSVRLSLERVLQGQ